MVKNDDASPPVSLAIFASGKGSNAKKIIEYFRDHTKINCTLLCTDQATSGIFNLSTEFNISTVHFKKKSYRNGKEMSLVLKNFKIQGIILAGYLKLIPKEVINAFPDNILNIHPSLLPAFGGKGMYGMNVHQAVIDAKESKSGISIHLVNPFYDKGKLIFQKAINVHKDWTAEKLKSEIQKLEHHFYPKIIERTFLPKNK